MKRHLRVMRRLATDPAIPRPVRWCLILAVLPIPGPVDEAALVLAALIVAIAYRGRVAHHYAAEDALVPITPVDTWGAWS